MRLFKTPLPLNFRAQFYMHFQYVGIGMSQGEDIFSVLKKFLDEEDKISLRGTIARRSANKSCLTFTLSLNLDRFLIGVVETLP